MQKIRLIIAVCACKAAIFLSKITGRNGSSMPGALAIKIFPEVLSHLARQIKKEIIVVCGTNGKTTTNNLLYSFIKSCGFSVVCNNVGANMLYGVCCAFVSEANIFGRLSADYACIEIDEASAVKVFKHFTPDKMIITNLFRDQLDRYGEIDITVKYLKEALFIAPDTELILNGDDPLVAQFGVNTDRRCYYMGIDEDAGISCGEIVEGRFCVLCGARLLYDFYHYSQLGKYACTKCGFKRPPLDFCVKDLRLFTNEMSWNLYTKGKAVPFDVKYKGFYNIYNICLSYCAAMLAVGDVNYKSILDGYKAQTGRMEEFWLRKKTILNLSKNPAGFNQAISTVIEDPADKDLLIAINDNAQDGKDISWLWDVDFERLNEARIKSFILCGTRANDMAVRLKYAGADTSKIQKFYDYQEAARAAANQDGEVCYALVNYTAVFKMQKILKKLEKEMGK